MALAAGGPERMDKAAIRHAATVIVRRNGVAGPEVLMGQRGAGAAFMPNKFVFPGGAVDAGDEAVPLAQDASPACNARLRSDAVGITPRALMVAAIRELWEETGLALGTPGPWGVPVPEDWQGFAARGLRPSAAGLRFVFRAITPPGRPRRFDARFFLIDAAAIVGDADDFSGACDELSHLQWVPLSKAQHFDLPFITEVVLAEIAAAPDCAALPASVPFFDNSADVPQFRRLT